MALKITDIRVSESRKRIDAKAEFEAGIFNIFDNAEEYTADFRIVSPTPIPEGEEDRMLRKIHQERENWVDNPKSKSLRMEGNATGYVLNYTPMADTPKDEAI